MTASQSRAVCVLALAFALAAVMVIPTAGAAQVRGIVPASLVDAPASLMEAPAAQPVVPTPGPRGFLKRQLGYPRVQQAYERKSERVEAVLDARGVEDLGEVFFRVFKREQELEVWARGPGSQTLTLVKTYPVCETSGRLGPKRRQGDLQIPEGFYSIDIFNPWSRFHLSMRVDYPNPVDRARGQGPSLGGDIYIHGGCSTIGCVPVTDDYIEELYLVAAAARDAGQQRIPVHIFPTRLDEPGLRWLAETYGSNYVDYSFWENLQEGYLAFERTRMLPHVGHEGGRYTFTSPATPPAPASAAPSRVSGR